MKILKKINNYFVNFGEINLFIYLKYLKKIFNFLNIN